MTKQLNQYFLYIEYMATGEGLTIHFGTRIAKNKKDAIKAFLKAGLCKHSGSGERLDEGVKYFEKGIQIFDVEKVKERNKAIEVLKNTKVISDSFIEKIAHDMENRGIHEFDFFYYINYS